MSASERQIKHDDPDEAIVGRLEQFYSTVDWQANDDEIASVFKAKPAPFREDREVA